MRKGRASTLAVLMRSVVWVEGVGLAEAAGVLCISRPANKELLVGVHSVQLASMRWGSEHMHVE